MYFIAEYFKGTLLLKSNGQINSLITALDLEYMKPAVFYFEYLFIDM